MTDVKALIKRRRRQILVHSYIYYVLNDNIISDAQWSAWAEELEQLQKDYPKESSEVELYDEFKTEDSVNSNNQHIDVYNTLKKNKKN